MARSSTQLKKDKDGKHRKETTEEKRARLESQQQAREYCERIVPFVLGAILVFVIFFGIYVRSLNFKAAPKTSTPEPPVRGDPGFVQMNGDPNLAKEQAETTTLDETMQLLKEGEATHREELKEDPILKVEERKEGGEL